jgi:hypothetical protein
LLSKDQPLCAALFNVKHLLLYFTINLALIAENNMAEVQPPTIVGGTTPGDVDDEIPQAAKSAEDRKAAAALSSLDARQEDDSASTKDVDQEAVKKAMDRLAGKGAAAGEVEKKEAEKKEVKKVKVDPADVALVVSFLMPALRFFDVVLTRI